MRYIGNKTRILKNIEEILDKKHLNGGVFADLFTGTGSVADHFKDRFEVIANDLMDYASIFAQAKITNATVPKFDTFFQKFGCSPFEYWNAYDYTQEEDGFITKEFSPKGDRKFFQEKNAIKIDVIRRQIDFFFKKSIFNDDERIFLIASLLESTMGVSNTSGTYEAFFKEWESRSYKDLLFEPLTLENRELYSKDNRVYTEDANALARKISGDVAYIDTPYTVTQYASAYHVLETIALNDNPEVRGKTGRRVERKMSNYSKKQLVSETFEDLFRQLQFKHIIISYSNQSLLPLKDLLSIVSKFSKHDPEVTEIKFREYKNLNSSKKGEKEGLREVLIYFEKDNDVLKSPLNYAGSKNQILPEIKKELPYHFSDFVDAMGGAFNVGINMQGMGSVTYNEKDESVFEMMNQLISTPSKTIEKKVKAYITEFHLEKANKESYLNIRRAYNSQRQQDRDPIMLYTLTLYSFQHMLRFNSSDEFNVPVGNSGYNLDIEDRLDKFHTKMPLKSMECGSFSNLDIMSFDEQTVFYFDPPYMVTSAAYNDGRRRNAGWAEKEELELLDFLERIDKSGRKFILSNVVVHNGMRNELLLDWIMKNNFNMSEISKSGKRYPRQEVLVKNY